MEFKDSVTTEGSSVSEEALIDLPVADEQSEETKAGTTQQMGKLIVGIDNVRL